MSGQAQGRERGTGLGGGNFAAWLAGRIVRWGHPRSQLPRTVLLIALFVLWLILGIVGWGQWTQRSGGCDGFCAEQLSDFPYLTLWLLTPQGDIAGGDVPLTLDLARYFGAAIPLLGLIFLVARQIGDALAESLTQAWAADHLVIVGQGTQAVQAAEAAAAEAAATVLIDPSIAESHAEDLNQLGVLVLRDDLTVAARKAGLKRARRVVVVGEDVTHNLSLAGRAAERLDADRSDLHVQIEDEDVLEMMRQSATEVRGSGPTPRPFSLAAAAARSANESLRLWDRDRGLHVAAVGSGPFSQAMVRQAISLGWRIGRPSPCVTLWDPTGEIEDRWTRMAPGVLGDLSLIYDRPAFEIRFSRAASIGAFLAETTDADAWVVEHDVGTACAAALMASRLNAGPLVVVSGEADLGRTLPGVHTAVAGFSAGLARAILPDVDLWAQRLHGAYESRGKEGYIELGASGSGVRWSVLAESLWSANRASASHIPVKLADADAAGADPRDDRDLLELLARIEHDRWCAERLLNGWRPGDRNNVHKLHPGLILWADLDEPTRQKDRDGVIDAFRVARPRPGSNL
ncbi:MAG: hypothetical protein J0L52_01840 [Caulobacterales bacterium]|nr:hypothetical protein [Caulobacterales bacterium]